MTSPIQSPMQRTHKPKTKPRPTRARTSHEVQCNIQNMGPSALPAWGRGYVYYVRTMMNHLV